MNWHESDVARFRKSENEYLPNFIEKYSPVFKILDFYFCLLFGISAVPSDFIWKCGICCAQSSIYHRVLQNVLVKHLKIVRYLRWRHTFRGVFLSISPSESKCCNFEIQYFRFKAFLDVVSAETGNCEPGTPFWLSQLKSNVKVGGSL